MKIYELYIAQCEDEDIVPEKKNITTRYSLLNLIYILSNHLNIYIKFVIICK